MTVTPDPAARPLPASDRDVSPMGSLIAVLRVRLWIVVATVALVVATATTLAAQQPERYEAKSQVLVNRSNLANVLTGIADPTEFDSNRVIQTQANLARAHRVAELVVQAAGTPRTAEQFLEQSKVATSPTTDLLTLSVEDERRATATALSAEYARQFIAYRQAETLSRLRRLRDDLAAELARLPDRSAAATDARRNLASVRNLIALGDQSLSLVQEARDARQTQPNVARSAIFALLLGLMLGVGLAFLAHRLDSRLRTSGELEARLGMALLGRLAAPPRRLSKEDRLVALHEPDGIAAEEFRVMRTNLMFVNVGREARSLLLTSALQSEGKSTTVANLAVTLARAGQHVILADFDFRRPYLERYFDLPAEPGLTGVILGQAALEDALVDISLEMAVGAPASSNGWKAFADAELRHGRLEVLPTGLLPPSVGEFIASAPLQRLLASLRERCDVLLIDGPPALQVGDTLALSPYVDGLVVVARLGVVRRRAVDELKRVLAASSAPVLGVVITDAASERQTGYGYGYGYGGEQETKRRARAPNPPAGVS